MGGSAVAMPHVHKKTKTKPVIESAKVRILS